MAESLPLFTMDEVDEISRRLPQFIKLLYSVRSHSLACPAELIEFLELLVCDELIDDDLFDLLMRDSLCCRC